jgi:hypothetical protein
MWKKGSAVGAERKIMRRGLTPKLGPGRAAPTATPIRCTRPSRKSRSGSSLLELVISMVLLAVALVGFTSVTTSSMVANETINEVARGKQRARAEMEIVQAADFSEAFALFNADPTDDPEGVGTAPGNFIAVPELELLAADPDGFVGEIIMPTAVGMGGGLELREDLTIPQLGMPRDLNGDGVVDALDHSGDYLILPVLVRLDWRSGSGPARVEFKTLLANF